MAEKWRQFGSGYFLLEGDSDVIVHDQDVRMPNTPVRWWYNVHGDIGHKDTEQEAKAHAEELASARKAEAT